MRVLFWILLATLALSGIADPRLHAVDKVPASRRTPIDLKDKLEKGLRARRPEEFAFIGRVVAMVDKGQLPLDLVRETFAWARKKRPYPYPYFERALKIRAAAIGIEVK